MPNASCFLFAYLLVLGLELVRIRVAGSGLVANRWLKPLLLGTSGVAILTHTLYLLDRVFLAVGELAPFAISWHDWGILTAWLLAVVYFSLLLRRSESWTGLFVLPILLALIGGAIALPPGSPNSSVASVTGWRLVHGSAMTVGTMLVCLGFAMAIMYFVQSWKLKSKKSLRGRFQLPSLEYLQAFGKRCLLGSAAAIGFGVISGVIMNLTRDGRVEWFDRGIVFSGGLFIWLVIASMLQWHLSRRGSGHATAWMNVLSFAIVAAALGLVLSTPHGGNRLWDIPIEPAAIDSKGAR